MTELAPPTENPLEEKPVEPQKLTGAKIQLSSFTEALLKGLQNIRKKLKPNDLNKLTVSRTVSFFAFVYEKVRNAIEYREEQLILRAAIERILKRRLALNPDAKGEAENLLRELVWARYFESGNLGDKDIDDVQTIIDRYMTMRKALLTGRDTRTKAFISQYIVDLMTCEIEEYLNPEPAERESIHTFYMYQILRQKIFLDDVSEEQKDSFFLVALDRSYRKSDIPYQRYHLFITFYKNILQYDEKELADLTHRLPQIFKKIEEIVMNPTVDRLTRYVRKELPAFLVLFDILQKKKDESNAVITHEESLKKIVDETCRAKYSLTQSRLRNLAIKSLIYIFATKMVLALILEYPISEYLYGHADLIPIAINSLFPPILMLFIVLLVKLPNDENTKRIFQRIIAVIDADQTFETAVAYKGKKQKQKKAALLLGFSTFYALTFLVTLYLIHILLKMINFSLVSEALFVFFVSVVTFFSFRIKQVANEYKLEEREGFLTPFIDFFFMPILSMGKFFSNEIGKLNFFILIFDFIIEAPFKLVFEIVEEWISFVRARKEEII